MYYSRNSVPNNKNQEKRNRTETFHYLKGHKGERGRSQEVNETKPRTKLE
jgi:hypothetical protein